MALVAAEAGGEAVQPTLQHGVAARGPRARHRGARGTENVGRRSAVLRRPSRVDRRHPQRRLCSREVDPELEVALPQRQDRQVSARRRGRRCVASPALPIPRHEAVRDLVRRGLLDRRWRKRCRSHGGTVPFPPWRFSLTSTSTPSYAAVEELEDPTLRTKPLVVGGDPQGRGVVATANYVARRFGIQSAMSSAEALRRCPELVVVRPRHALYRQYSEAVWSTIREVVPRVEQVGIDEGYLDIGTVVSSFARARAVAQAVQTSVRAATSLSCSLGVSTSKVVCKVASDRRKPGGITVVPPGTRGAFPRAVPGAHAARGRPQGRGAARGRGCEDDRRPGHALEQRAPGRAARRRRAAPARSRAGIDPRDLELESKRVSISVEETFERDISDRTDPPRRGPAYGRRARSPHATQRDQRPHRHGEAALRGLLDPLPLDHARARPSTRASGSANWPAGCSTAACATAPGRCGSSASASRASPTTASSRLTMGRSIPSAAQVSSESTLAQATRWRKSH